MKLTTMMSTMLASSLLLAGLTSGPALADDGAITNKSMSRTIEPPAIDYGQDIVNNAVREDEHAFTDMMGFYVPAQPASGLPTPIEYYNIDGTLVETLEVAKPLVNVFIHGPKFGVPETAFGHSFMDTYAAVSLNDGENWKQVNLSESADNSSFDLEEDHNPSGPGSGDPLPGDHVIRLGNAFHANGYETPYTAECTECHGQGLQGVAQVPSCYSCHDNKWEEETPVEIGPVIYMAELEGQDKKKSKMKLEGENAGDSVDVTIRNAITDEAVATVEAEDDGKFKLEEKFEGDNLPPCVVFAEYTDNTGEVLTGPSLAVKDKKTGEPIENCEGSPVNLTEYPGGTYNVFHATAGNKTLVAWPSRFCSSGQPAYTMTTDSGLEDPVQQARLAAITAFIKAGDADLGVPPLPEFTSTIDGVAVDDLYLVDAFGVAGSQGSIDFADEGYPQAGVVPFGCVWTARGTLLPGDDPRTDELEESHMVWTKAERLTSGRRDPNRIEVHAVKGAGFVVTWQEDPEGLRPGQGLGPGQGWSGAVAHSQTDAWYSFINEEYFDIVETVDNTTVPIDILAHDLTLSGRPQVFVPMAVPMRLSNNAKCNPPDTVTAGGGTEDLYCLFDDIEDDNIPVGASAFGLNNNCAETVTILTGNPDSADGTRETEICVADTNDDGVADLPNRANTALTRPRTSLQGYDSDGDDAIDSAWVIVAAEESKGLGKFFFEPSTDGLNAIPCEEGSSETCTEEIGKNQWYFSFDMGTPDTSAGFGVTDSLVESLVSQGNMLNQGEVYWDTGLYFGLMNTEDMEDYGDYNFDILNTEIARRASLLVQSIAKAEASQNRLLALPSWKQGIMRQGGPADTMLRRIELPEDEVDGSPYAFRNMVCESFLIEAGTNPYYPDGVCNDPAVNLSGNMPDTCVDDGDGEDVCPVLTCDEAGICTIDTNPILQGVVQGEGNQQRVLTWHQCPSEWSLVAADDGLTPVACETDENHLDDQSWYNPLDISKGHRGFIDGDFVMFLHGWSPNWRLNAKGNDRYDLYVRRSFDGANSWTTTPTDGLASDGVTAFGGDGTVTCESYRPEETTPGERAEPTACFDFDAGVAEHMRNVTQHRAMRITTLDPRYAATKATIEEGCTDGLFVDTSLIPNFDLIFTCDDGSETNELITDSDLRDPSRYFMVYETGDNTTVEVGEAEPLDLFYSRAEGFGDDYVVWAETDSDTADLELCYPNDAHEDEFVIGTVVEDSGFCNEFDNMNTGGDTHASEANLESNPDGSKLYGVWAQWTFDDTGEVDESDAMARRIWWIDDYICAGTFVENCAWSLPGTSGGSTQ